ncbi:SDR family oxidoreductase [Burkholderia multivorans]|uniref:SDR family oxidoreductase n=1 Tax=Burkholderia multivorans TaxID=87883 RepID=UPI001C231165|nr:SDR family oxidoreductase [Burkholderia multivorans]MBU9477685.1 SDR family oxidoreductase [Burkholderia multivorans]
MNIDFNNRVAVVTGAGAGLGRSHALLLASRGAKVVVNDPGSTPSGEKTADKVVAEIKAAGGEAVAHYGSIAEPEGAADLIDTAVRSFGTVDILVNNAGFLRDKSFAKIDLNDFDAVMRVHLSGSAYCTRAAWPIMQKNGYGRIVFTTSNAGLYGNFGQSNYGAAKAGLVGLMNVLAIEGAKYNIRTNIIAPMAATQMTESVMSADLLPHFKPELVSAAVAYLCSEKIETSGSIVSAAAGHYSSVKLVSSEGVFFAPGETVTPETIADSWAKINDFSHYRTFSSAGAEVENIAELLSKSTV